MKPSERSATSPAVPTPGYEAPKEWKGSPFKVGVMCRCSGSVFPSFAVELRRDGMTITTRHSLKGGDPIGLRFPLPGAGRLELLATCGEQVPSEKSHTFLTEVHFQGLSTRQQDSLALWIESSQKNGSVAQG